ncbi:MAG TPA: hypothetical protein VHO07_26685 [Streptosporangiaceae bacterium]|jgi:hypothetical protein|nr:hypothetical protein [Streptosporangiaceae bacterium]
MSAIGSRDFGGANWIPARWDSVVVAVIGLVGYEWGVRDAVRHLTAHPAPEPASADPEAEDALDNFGAAPAGSRWRLKRRLGDDNAVAKVELVPLEQIPVRLAPRPAGRLVCHRPRIRCIPSSLPPAR